MMSLEEHIQTLWCLLWGLGKQEEFIVKARILDLERNLEYYFLTDHII